MLTTHPDDSLVLCRERTRQLRAESAAEHLRRATRRRSALAASLRRAADRLDRARLSPHPA